MHKWTWSSKNKSLILGKNSQLFSSIFFYRETCILSSCLNFPYPGGLGSSYKLAVMQPSEENYTVQTYYLPTNDSCSIHHSIFTEYFTRSLLDSRQVNTPRDIKPGVWETISYYLMLLFMIWLTWLLIIHACQILEKSINIIYQNKVKSKAQIYSCPSLINPMIPQSIGTVVYIFFFLVFWLIFTLFIALFETDKVQTKDELIPGGKHCYIHSMK